jgi:hypothetical protein
MKKEPNYFLWAIVAVVCGFTLGFCHPAPAQELRDTMRPDPYYSRYPFQSPAQASRQLDADREARRYQDRQLDAIDAAARRAEQAADQRDFQRRLEAIYER